MVEKEDKVSEMEETALVAYRDEAWLDERVNLLREMHFADVPQGYPITTRFGIRARNRFGSIGAQDHKTIIMVNRLFADPCVPTFVVDGTLVHELAHYAHGFGSGLPKLYSDPHRGGVVDKELEKRGLGDITRKSELWRSLNWETFYRSRCEDLTSRRDARRDEADIRWDALLKRTDSRTELELHGRLVLLAPRLGVPSARSLPFSVEWLRATRRQSGLSYWFAKSRIVRVHGLLADRRVPAAVLEFELACWLARHVVGSNWQKIQATLGAADMNAVMEEALHWQRRSWTAFRNRHHPLK
jgi:hypothetical protein